MGSVIAGGGSIGLLTVTTPHRAGWSTAAAQDVLSGVWHAVMNARGVKAGLEHAGYDGYVRGLDHTYGENGPHPHFHALIAFRGTADAEHLEALRQEMTAAANRYLERKGLWALHPEHGIGFELADPTEGAAAVTDYVLKSEAANEAIDTRRASWEVAGGRGKRAVGEHRTPFELLVDFSEWGDAEDLEIWRDYERSTRGKRHLVWSRNGFRERHLGDVEERTDEEIAQDSDSDVREVAVADRDQWSQVTGTRGRVAQLMEAVTRSGDDDRAYDVVQTLFEEWDLGPPERPPDPDTS